MLSEPSGEQSFPIKVNSSSFGEKAWVVKWCNEQMKHSLELL
jgi:hypothetical protein